MTHAHPQALYPRTVGGRGIPMFRLFVLIAILYLICCGLALGQVTGGSNSANPAAAARIAAAAPVATPGSSPQPYYGQRAPSPQDSPSIGVLMQRNGGSLLQATLLAAPDPDRATLAGISPTAVPDLRPKLLRKHDLLTIIIHEEGQNSSNGSSDLSKTADLDAKLNNFVELNIAKMRLTGVSPSIVPELNLAGKRDFKGTATVQRADIVTDRVQAEVVDIKPNNTLVLQARKRIKADEEFQEFIMTGICRAEDVTADNTVLSTQCFDLTIQKNNKGTVNTTTKKGFIPKLLDFIDPF